MKRTLLTEPIKVDFLLQQEHQLPLMLEAVVTHARGLTSGGLPRGLMNLGLWFVTNQVLTSDQDVHCPEVVDLFEASDVLRHLERV